jgi:hypothetical protein
MFHSRHHHRPQTTIIKIKKCHQKNIQRNTVVIKFFPKWNFLMIFTTQVPIIEHILHAKQKQKRSFSLFYSSSETLTEYPGSSFLDQIIQELKKRSIYTIKILCLDESLSTHNVDETNKIKEILWKFFRHN